MKPSISVLLPDRDERLWSLSWQRARTILGKVLWAGGWLWVLGVWWLGGMGPPILECRAEAGGGKYEEWQKRWPNGPFKDPRRFPIGVWLQDPRNAERYKQIGITLYIGLWKGPTEAQLAELRRHQMPVVCAQNAYALAHLEEKLFVGWLQEDEPDNAQPLPGGKGYGPPIPPEQVIQRYTEMRRRDPTRPVLLNLGQAVAWDGWHGRGVRSQHPEDYPLYVQGGDIVSFDIYPVVHPKPAVAGKLWYVPHGVHRLRQWAGPDRMVWNCIETTRISNLHAKPTPQQVKAEVWMSLIYGSQGIIYFCHQFKPNFVEAALLADPEMAEAVGKINRQIHELAPVLWTPERRELVQVLAKPAEVPEELARLLGPVGIAATARLWKNKLYVFAVRMQPTEAQAEFRIAGMAGSTKVQVLGEERWLPVREGMFIDHFGPWEVHLYAMDFSQAERTPPAQGHQTSQDPSKGVPGHPATPLSEDYSPQAKELPLVEFYPEMSYPDSTDRWIGSSEWTEVQKAQVEQLHRELLPQWKAWASQYGQKITPERVRELSRWATKEMAQYRSVPPLEKTHLEPVALAEEGHRLVAEGTIDTLPTHHRLVTRWLKVYIHYDLERKKLVRCVFTIRGQREE